MMGGQVTVFETVAELHQVEVGVDVATGRDYTVLRVVALDGQQAFDPLWARDVVPFRVRLTVQVEPVATDG